MSAEDALAWMKRFPKHSGVSYATPLTYEGYSQVPVSWLFCEKDQVIPPKAQEAAIELIEKTSGNKVDVTRINAGHCPSILAGQEVVDWIVGLVGKNE